MTELEHLVPLYRLNECYRRSQSNNMYLNDEFNKKNDFRSLPDENMTKK
jgi:hypothetical protein